METNLNTVFYNVIFIFGGTALRIAIAIMLSEIIGNVSVSYPTIIFFHISFMVFVEVLHIT